MDMMRPVSVAMPPVKPDGLAWSITGNGNNTRLTLTWNDNSIAETAYVVQRMNGTGAWADVGTIHVAARPIRDTSRRARHTGPMSFADTTFRWNTDVYQYRVVAKNTVGYLDGAGPGGFADMTAQSVSDAGGRRSRAPTNLTATLPGRAAGPA